MRTQAKERFSREAERLIVEGEAILRNQIIGQGAVGPSYIVVSQPPMVHQEDMVKWITGCRNLVTQLGQRASAWEDSFKDRGVMSMAAQKALGSIRALKESIDRDLLDDAVAIITSDAFADLLEQATELIDKGYVLAAGVLARAVLEEHLRKLCERGGCVPAGRPTISDFNQSLYKTGLLDKLGMQTVTTMAMAGNHCAHNIQPPLPESDVRKLLSDLTVFIGRHPLS